MDKWRIVLGLLTEQILVEKIIRIFSTSRVTAALQIQVSRNVIKEEWRLHNSRNISIILLVRLKLLSLNPFVNSLTTTQIFEEYFTPHSEMSHFYRKMLSFQLLPCNISSFMTGFQIEHLLLLKQVINVKRI